MLPETYDEKVKFFLSLLSDKNSPMSLRLSRCAKILAHYEKFKGTMLGVRFFDVQMSFEEAMYEYSRKAIV